MWQLFNLWTLRLKYLAKNIKHWYSQRYGTKINMETKSYHENSNCPILLTFRMQWTRIFYHIWSFRSGTQQWTFILNIVFMPVTVFAVATLSVCLYFVQRSKLFSRLVFFTVWLSLFVFFYADRTLLAVTLLHLLDPCLTFDSDWNDLDSSY